MPIHLIVLTYLLSSSTFIWAQSEKEVMSVVNQLFVAMETNDGKLAKSLLMEAATLQTIYKNKDGNTALSTISVSKLAEAFAAPKELTYSEPIWNEKVHIDGDYAFVWVDYAFYLGDTFFHCGVDAFQLIYLDDQWKIFALTDTRRKSDCIIPEEIKKRYKH